MKSPFLQLSPNVLKLSACVELWPCAFARCASAHSELHLVRYGGMQRQTAWLLTAAYADLVDIDVEPANPDCCGVLGRGSRSFLCQRDMP